MDGPNLQGEHLIQCFVRFVAFDKNERRTQVAVRNQDGEGGLVSMRKSHPDAEGARHGARSSEPVARPNGYRQKWRTYMLKAQQRWPVPKQRATLINEEDEMFAQDPLSGAKLTMQGRCGVCGAPALFQLLGHFFKLTDVAD